MSYHSYKYILICTLVQSACTDRHMTHDKTPTHTHTHGRYHQDNHVFLGYYEYTHFLLFHPYFQLHTHASDQRLVLLKTDFTILAHC